MNNCDLRSARAGIAERSMPRGPAPVGQGALKQAFIPTMHGGRLRNFSTAAGSSPLRGLRCPTRREDTASARFRRRGSAVPDGAWVLEASWPGPASNCSSATSIARPSPWLSLAGRGASILRRLLGTDRMIGMCQLSRQMLISIRTRLPRSQRQRRWIDPFKWGRIQDLSDARHPGTPPRAGNAPASRESPGTS